MEKCPNFNGIAYRLNLKLNRYEFIRLRCKQWDCEFCAVKNKKHWVFHLNTEFNKLPKSYKWSFVTITANAKSHYSKTTFEVINSVWRKWTEYQRRIWRKLGLSSTLEYVRLYEAHKSGNMHIHAICASEIPLDRTLWHSNQSKNASRSKNFMDYQNRRKRSLSAHMRQRDLIAIMGGGYQFDSRVIKSDVPLVVHYVTKYMTKEIMSLELPKHARRIATSSSIASLNQTKFADDNEDWNFGEGWHYEQQIIAEKNGIGVYDLSKRVSITLSDFKNSVIYI